MNLPKLPFDQIKQKQSLLLWGLISVLSVVLLVLIMMLINQTEYRTPPKKGFKSEVTTAASRITPQDTWMEKVNNELQLMRKQQEATDKAIDNLVKINTEKPALPTGETEKNSVEELKSEIKQSMLPPPPQQLPPPPSGIQGQGQPIPTFRSSGIHKMSINLVNSRQDKPLKTVDNYIPANSFAPGIVVVGVDASTSINASSDPLPMSIYITEDAYLPNNFRGKLKGCHVSLAAAGDVSSERAKGRLEMLSCVEKETGEIIEVKVEGFLVGTDSRAGQRGRLVDRTGPLMRNAAVGGFLSGMADFMSQNKNPIKFLPSGIAESDAQPMKELFGQGLAKGAGSALDKYADYYIKRAEQMQPILEIVPGQEVAVYFQKGFSLSESLTRSAISKVNDQKRYQQINEISEMDKPVDSWIPNGEQK